jgi:hypothetical protein
VLLSHLHRDLLYEWPVLLLYAPQHLQLSPLNINLEQVNTPAGSSATCQHYMTPNSN